MFIKKFHAQNFRNIDNLTFDFINEDGSPKSFIVLIGDNGTGKTTILEGITKALVPIIRPISSEAVKYCELTDNDIKFKMQETSIDLTIELENEDFCCENKKTLGIKTKFSINNSLFLKTFKNKYEALKKEGKLPLVLYYGTNRVLNVIPKRVHSKDFKIEDALKNCFDNSDSFKDFYEWFKAEEDIELRELRENPQYINRKLQAVRQAVTNMIPGYNNLRIKANPSRMIVYDKDKEELKIEQLSGGYKAILSVVADIAKRLALAYPYSENPLQEEAVILIDELDLHLHPRWQKNIVATFKATFPNCQFITSTHSPFIIQSLNQNEIINLDQTFQTSNRGSFAGWSIEEIQEHLMNVDINTEKFEDIIHKFSTAIDNEDIQTVKELYPKLVEMTHPESTKRKLIDIDMKVINADD